MLSNSLRNKPFFYILLPVFFVWHGFTANYNAIPIKDVSILVLTYLIVSLLFFAVGWTFYRNSFKAALFSFSVMSFHFFFGAVQDFLKAHFDDSFFTRYSFLLPFFFLLLVTIAYSLKRTTNSLIRFCYYLNILISVLILLDAGVLIQKLLLNRSSNDPKTLQTANWNTSLRPDVYFLLFDEYTSTRALKEEWNYDNSELDSFLSNKGFKLLPNSRSNYNFTEFSMASTLNMNYLSIPSPSSCTIKDYNNCFEQIRDNKVCATFASLGYEIVNYSIFDLQKNPSLVKEDFLPLKTRLITSQTFLSRIEKDLAHLVLVGKYQINLLSQNLIYRTYHNNQKIISAILNDSNYHSNVPKFLYSHIEMPHPPFYLNKMGQEKPKEEIIKNNGINSYLDYIPPTNEVIKKIVNTIFLRANRPFVIVLMGDHGFRLQQERRFHFRNLNSVYLSSKNYKGFYDSISNVNEFRVLMNNIFDASLPLQKDSSIFLLDKN
ncbi:MAG: sulfatase-like hydrolase/transferase [Flavisolibacter sp.]